MIKILSEFIRHLFSNKRGIVILLEEAKSFEDAGDYESACYSYACAIDRGERAPIYKSKMRNLIKTFGPFTYEKQLARMKKEYCSCCDSCGEGYHHIILSTIQKLMRE